MTSIARIIISDFVGLIRVCGVAVACKWLLAIICHFPSCIKRRDLHPADRALGFGPFRAKYGKAHAQICAPINGIREIWVRDAYLGKGFLSIPPNATVVDIGANNGNFTILALAHGPGVRVVCVEPSISANKICERQVKLNGW